MSTELFPERSKSKPVIYAYTDNHPAYAGMLKIGFTTRTAEERVAEQYPVLRPGPKPYTIVFTEPAVRDDGTGFNDHDIHAVMHRMRIQHEEGEWFSCNVEQVRAAYISVRDRKENLEMRSLDFSMRPEQEAAVRKTMAYFQSVREDLSTNASPKFLWNAKMRFGKTFAAYQLAKKMEMKKILVLTFKPAVESAWEEDLLHHVDFEGWQFISRTTELTYEKADLNRPIVCFGSFQDYLGTEAGGRIKAKNEWVHTTNWDLVIFDEYHFGAWRDNARKLFADQDEDDVDFDSEAYQKDEAGNAMDESFLPITSYHYLFLSGTPFRALGSGEFIEEQIFSWTYSDEQSAKEDWGNRPDNPYLSLPQMVLMTYRLPAEITRVAEEGEFNEFDLNVFFSAEGEYENARFVYEDYVQKWLDLIRGAYMPAATDDLKLGWGKPALPYSDSRLLSVLTHTLWFMPNVSACYAMANLLKQRQNIFCHDYTVNVAAGTRAGVGLAAVEPVKKSMANPLESKTITLTCGKLTTGVTIRPWTGIFMLRNLKSPETYFQAAFRVQSPWVIKGEDGKSEIIKEVCYVFDFAIDRALKQIADYSVQLNVEESNPEVKVGEFIRFLPVLAYDGSTMKRIDAAGVLDMALSGTTATLLAKRWESVLLVNVDNLTLGRLMANQEAMDALMRVEGFRSLNQDIETIINKSEAVKKAKKEQGDSLSKEQRKELSEEEKEFKSLRKQIQEKLIKLATRLPIFMYLTDYREHSLKEIIRNVETGLFRRVTGLGVNDFDLLVSLGVFNGPLMNDAIWKFKRYEDSSLTYAGVNRHEGERVGAWDTSVSYEDYLRVVQSRSPRLWESYGVYDVSPASADEQS